MSSRSQTSRVQVDLIAVIVAMRDREPHVLTISGGDGSAIALPSGPLQSGHTTLQAGLRRWVQEQTNRTLGYVEQLYSFGDHAPYQPGAAGGQEHQTVSIAYLALDQASDADLPAGGRWRRWYEFFPWEDRRQGDPPARAALLALSATATEDPDQILRLFGDDAMPWDEERALERYESLYQAGLAPESWIDRGEPPAAAAMSAPGLAMAADHRRILATAISRLRAKIKYRPVLFELMPTAFTLTELQQTAEALSGMALHKQNFRRLVASRGLVEETGAVAADTGGRPAKLMRFRKDVTLERPGPGVRLGATRRGAYP